MQFTIDAQLPPALAVLLCKNGHNAVHVTDIGLRHSDDTAIWKHAIEHEAIIITKDEDFAHRSNQSKVTPVIVWLRVKNVSRKALLEWFEPLLPQIEAMIAQGERLIEVR